MLPTCFLSSMPLDQKPLTQVSFLYGWSNALVPRVSRSSCSILLNETYVWVIINPPSRVNIRTISDLFSQLFALQSLLLTLSFLFLRLLVEEIKIIWENYLFPRTTVSVKPVWFICSSTFVEKRRSLIVTVDKTYLFSQDFPWLVPIEYTDRFSHQCATFSKNDFHIWTTTESIPIDTVQGRLFGLKIYCSLFGSLFEINKYFSSFNF